MGGLDGNRMSMAPDVTTGYSSSRGTRFALAKFRLWEPLTQAKPTSGVELVAPWLDRILFSSLDA